MYVCRTFISVATISRIPNQQAKKSCIPYPNFVSPTSQLGVKSRIPSRYLSFSPAPSPVVPASFNVTSPVKLVGRTRLELLAINGKSKMAEAKCPTSAEKIRQLHFVSIIYNDPWMFGRDVCNLYIRNILWSSQKKEGFRRAISGTFSRWTGTFLPFCARPSRYRVQFQASSFHLDSGNWPGDEAAFSRFPQRILVKFRIPLIPFQTLWEIALLLLAYARTILFSPCYHSFSPCRQKLIFPKPTCP